MKTSKILTALVLPAMLAACTAEDIVTTNNVAQSERPLLNEDFRLISEGEGEGVNSRFYMAGSTTLNTVWEDGDKYGAALIDQYNPAYPRNPEKWDVIYSLAGNVPFIYDAAADEWKAVAATGVGHYLFSFPYNINDQNRAAVSWELPAIQELYSDENGEVELNAAINKYNKSVSAALLTENATAHSVTMRNLFAYPKFVIKFDNGLPITTVSQVVLEKADGTKFAIKGGFDHKKVAVLFDTDSISKEIKDNKLADEAAYWAGKQTENFVINTADAATYTVADSTKYIVAKLPNNTKVKVDGNNNKYVEVRFMIPGHMLDYTTLYGANYNMYIYTNNGVYEIMDVANNIDFKDTTPVETKKRIFARNASYTLNLEKDAPEKSDEELYIVTDIADWNALVEKYGASTAYVGEGALNVAVLGENFTLDSTAKMPTKADFKVTTDIAVDGTVALQNVFVGEGCKVVVKEGATLNIVDNSNDIKVIENHGTLNIKKYAESRAEVIKKIKTIGTVENMPNAVLNIEKDAEVEFTLNNNIDDKKLTLNHGKVVNEGVLTLKGGKNVGEFVNNGYVIVTGAYTNEEEQYIGVCDGTEHKECEHYTPVMTNNKSFVANGAEFTNEGNFINAATGNVSCSGGAAGKFTNKGYVKATKDGTLLLTSNTGTIELDEINQAKWSLEAANAGTILYYAKSTDTALDFSASAVTKFVIGDQNMSITKTGELNEVEMGEGTLTLPKYVADSQNAATLNNDTQLAGTLTLKGGDVVIASELAQITSLVIEEDASLTINKNNKVYAGTTKNAGAVLVAGAFETASTEADATVKDAELEIEGIFNSTQGTSNNIKFAVENAELQTALDTAVENLVLSLADNCVALGGTFATFDSWSDITYETLKGGQPFGINYQGQDAWVKDYAEALITAYNKLRIVEDPETFVNLKMSTPTETNTSVIAILDTLQAASKLDARIAAAKATAKTNLETAIAAAKTNKQLNASWNTVGYAYTGVATDLNAMWTAYGQYLKTGMASWTVNNATTGLPEKKYALADGNTLKGSYQFAIKAEILDKVGDNTSITFTTPVGAYVNADYQTTSKTTASEAIYNAVKAYITYTVGSDVTEIENYSTTVALSALQTWCFKLNQVKDESFTDVNSYNAKQAIKDYASTVIGLAETAEYSEENLNALANLIKLGMVEGLTELNQALAAGIPVIEMTGVASLSDDLTLTKNVVLKGGTFEGASIIHLNAENVVLDGVTFKNGSSVADCNMIEIEENVKKLVIKNCTFEGFKYDAIQAGGHAADGIEVVIEGNTFIAPTTNIANGSYISLGFGNGKTGDTSLNSASVTIKNNNFDKFANVGNAIKIYGVKDLSKVVVGGNKIATAKADVTEEQIIISCSNDQTQKRYDVKVAYDKLTGTAAALSNDGIEAAAD